MLILSRKRGECIVIPGCSVTVTVVAVEGHRVRLGIDAPAGVIVLREELVRGTNTSEGSQANASNAGLPPHIPGKGAAR